MLLSIADSFDTMNNACIELTSMLAQELGIGILVLMVLYFGIGCARMAAA